VNASKRRAEILNIINQEGDVAVDALIQQYQVSEETIRRDLRILDENGYVKRVYGGAVRLEKTTRYIPYEDRLMIQYSEKLAIGNECLQYLEDGDSVFIDGRTTCLVFSSLIPVDMNITVVTNSVTLAQNLMSKKGNLKIHVVGGELNSEGLLTGPKVYEELKNFRFDKAIFSCIGLNEKGCYFAKSDAQQVSYILNKVSSKLILLVDSSKVNRQAFLLGLGLDQFHTIITDEKAPQSFLEQAESLKCNIVKAKLHDEKKQQASPIEVDFDHRVL